MKKRSKAYPFYDRDDDIPESATIPLTDQAFDSLLTTDRLEIDRIRWELERCLDGSLPRRFEEIPAIRWIGRAIEKKLMDAGFGRAAILGPKRLYSLIQTMNAEQWSAYTGKPLEGFPKKSFCLSDDKKQIWISEDIEASLHALWAYQRLKVAVDAPGNHPAALCALTFQFFLNAERSGVLRKTALAGKRQSKKQRNTQTKRKTWGGLTKQQIKKRDQRIIDKFKSSKLTMSNFAKRNKDEFGLSETQIRTIIRPSKK